MSPTFHGGVIASTKNQVEWLANPWLAFGFWHAEHWFLLSYLCREYKVRTPPYRPFRW